MLTEKRRYSLGIWALGLGYFLSYTPYSGLTKALSNGLFTSTHGPVKGPVLLPISAIATVIGMWGFITVMGWWKYAGRREFFGHEVPFPRKLTDCYQSRSRPCLRCRHLLITNTRAWR